MALMQHADWSVRSETAAAFCKLDKSVQKQHAEALVALLQHEDSGVQNAAACAFRNLMHLFS